jgi:AraC-like DNA-binding protein
VSGQLERYTLEELLVPAAQIRILRQRLRRAGVHWHDYYELVYVLDGTARHVVNGLEHPLAPGSAFMMTPADFHEIFAQPGETLTCYNVVIDPCVLPGAIGEILPLAGEWPVWMVDDFRDGEADFHRLWQESEAGRPGMDAVMQALLRCVLIGLARRLVDGTSQRRPVGGTGADLGMRRAVMYVDHSFREPITLADAAAQAHLSPNYFSERFHEITGVSFQVYLQQRRLRFARSLLSATDLGVTEVCHSAGFNSLSHFGRAYRRRYGQSPSAFRHVGSGGPVDRERGGPRVGRSSVQAGS